jgi:hypothetical protein
MTTPTSPERIARRKAGLTLAGITITVVAVLVVVAALLVAHYSTSPHPAAPAPAPTSTPRPVDGDNLPAAENALAAKPMLALPAEAAQPQPLTSATAGEPIALPAPTQTAGRWIPGGFSGTPEGALAQLKALDETALTGGDPQVYASGYKQMSAPGAPDPGSTGLYSLLTSMRARAGVAATGTVSGLTFNYQVSAAQVKGTLDEGRYAVVCVLGQVSAGFSGQITSLGIGDCQAMTWTGTQWLIAPGVMASAAPCAWPGSAPAVNAGYRAVS